MFLGHHWAVYGKTEIKTLLNEQSELYKFIHDQTIRLINHGLTPSEIAEKITLPQRLAKYNVMPWVLRKRIA